MLPAKKCIYWQGFTGYHQAKSLDGLLHIIYILKNVTVSSLIIPILPPFPSILFANHVTGAWLVYTHRQQQEKCMCTDAAKNRHHHGQAASLPLLQPSHQLLNYHTVMLSEDPVSFKLIFCSNICCLSQLTHFVWKLPLCFSFPHLCRSFFLFGQTMMDPPGTFLDIL